MHAEQPKLSVIAPMFNEEAIIGVYLQRTIDVLKEHCPDYEIILVDDGSSDATVDICIATIKKNKRVRLISFSRNYGHEIASTAGLDHARGDWVILMDTDLQHPPEVIPELIAKVTEGFDVVCASRRNRLKESKFRKITADLFYRFSRKMTGFDLPANIGNFRLITRKVVESLKKMKESNRHLVMMFEYVGFKTISIDYDCPPRIAGTSKYNLRKLMGLALDSIIGFSARPLHTMSFLSVFISIVMMLYAGFILMERLFTHQHLAEGIASIIFLISGLFSILFLFLAVISEYISRILIETKNRPLYNIKQEINHDSLQHRD